MAPMRTRVNEGVLSLLAGILLAGCGGKSLTGAPGGFAPKGRGGATGGGASSGTGTASGSGAASGGGAAGGGVGAGDGEGGATGDAAGTFAFTFHDGGISNNVDLLFVIDDSASTTAMQQKFLREVPAFFQTLELFPAGLPNLHVAVVSSDMGAPGDASSSIGCTATGDRGEFQSLPRGLCTDTTLSSGATFLSDIGGQRNFTGSLDQAFQCIGQLGSSGCLFQQPLAAIARALGADGARPPEPNAGFLRPNALLGIVVLTRQDDCSAPANTTIFSLNGGPQSITNPDGPVTSYRCNGGPRGGHLCIDLATDQTVTPPLTPPADAAGDPPVLDLWSCRGNQTGNSALTPVDNFIKTIRAAKIDPDHQIVLATIAAPPDPYSVAWVPAFGATPDGAGELWPQVMHSCGAPGGDLVNPHATALTNNGISGDPAARLGEFASSFPNSASGSVCDSSYASTLASLASKLGNLLSAQKCVVPPADIAHDALGNPDCTVTTRALDDAGRAATVTVPDCNEDGGALPCWTLTENACPDGGPMFNLRPDQAALNAASLTTTLTCQVAPP